MAETSVHGAVRRRSSGDRPNRHKRRRPPPPSSDLISALPDAVIHHIFSFLPLKDVVKTSVLSKRWRSTWTTTTHLDFRYLRPRDHKRWPSLIESLMRRCASPQPQGRRLAPLRGGAPCGGSFPASFNPLKGFYKLPEFLYRLSRLVRLQVVNCRFSLGTTIRWPCLKVLVIGSKLSDDILEGIVRGSPVLESLELRCWGVKNIIIDSRSVKELVIHFPTFDNMGKIWAPHLLSLRVSGVWDSYSMFRLAKISSLVEAKLDFFMCGDKRTHRDLLKEFFEKLRGVSTITIGGWCLQGLSLLEVDGVPSPLSKCQNLTLHALVSQWDLPGIAYLLQSSQCLEKLVIHLTGTGRFVVWLDEESKDRFNFDEEEFLCSRKGNLECLAKHLRRVEIIGYEANSFESKHLLALIKFLLGNALVLKKLIIKAELPTRRGQKRLQATVLSKLLGVSQNVLSYQRASKNAEIIFDHPFKEYENPGL
ncbi:putative F-box/LRR-repeat protein At3g18150 [Eucalyptus grandis]|uniref:putative F-box/LRR-repeat protein At3g18150 n=1 Tax=Eucalyptus grandis TaxID=71139 RepID=UPI00192E9744|nr:putative F-box/LRR-repeat protein At3g18150 [Eucalyptus grandis]